MSMCFKRASAQEATLLELHLFSMASPKTCAELKLPVMVDNDQIIEQTQRAQWIRAAILGANDGLLSTAALMLGVGAAKEDRMSMVLSGLAGALAGASSMAVGEFVSVSVQRDIQKATISNCNSEPKTCSEHHHHHEIKLNLNASPTIFVAEKLSYQPKERISPVITLEPKLLPASSPAQSPMVKLITEVAKSKIAAAGRDHYPREEVLPNPYKAAVASSLAFLCGSFVPLASAIFVVQHITRIVVVAVVTSVALALFGGLGARLGGSPIRVSAVRVLVGGWTAMAATYSLLKLFDTDRKGYSNKD